MFSLRHPLTGQLLSTTQRSYDTHCGLEVLEGLEMVEVAGTEAGAADQEAIWRVTASRAPELGGYWLSQDMKTQSVSVEQLDTESREELYGRGTTERTTTASSKVNNTQASTADLRILQQRELDLLRQLQLNQQAGLAVEAGLAEDGFSLESVLGSDVLHPVDSYNLVKRTARTWPRQSGDLSLVQISRDTVF